MAYRWEVRPSPGFLTGSHPAHSPLAVTGSLTRTITVDAVARAVSVAAVAAGVWASGAAALGPSSGVTSLRNSDVSRDLSLDDLVGSNQDRLRDREAEGPRRLDVDHELELGRLLDWKIGGLRTPQNLVNVSRRPTGEVRNIRPVAHETAGLHSLSENIHSW